jgi:hypothetical protein
LRRHPGRILIGLLAVSAGARDGYGAKVPLELTVTVLRG